MNPPRLASWFLRILFPVLGEQMDQILSVAVAAVVSILVVLLTRKSETIKHFQELRSEAYVDFIRGIAGLAIIQKREAEAGQEYIKGEEMLILVTNAKARIALYGSASVISSLARFLRGGAALDSPERAEAFMKICLTMRNDRSDKAGKVTNEDIHFLLFGIDPGD